MLLRTQEKKCQLVICCILADLSTFSAAIAIAISLTVVVCRSTDAAIVVVTICIKCFSDYFFSTQWKLQMMCRKGAASVQRTVAWISLRHTLSCSSYWCARREANGKPNIVNPSSRCLKLLVL